MSKLTRLQTKLTRIENRITEIEAAYPTIVKYKSYSFNFNEASAAYQDFGAVAQEYMKLLSEKDAIEDRIDEINGDDGGSAVSAFRIWLSFSFDEKEKLREKENVMGF